MPLRFNHMELTLPLGSLDEGGIREDIRKFYGEVFGFSAQDFFIIKQNALLLTTDAESSQFLLLLQSEKPMRAPGYDHLGFLIDTRAEVDELLARCKAFQQQDERVMIKTYDDSEIPTPKDITAHAFYVKYLLPIWFDVQCLEFHTESVKPARDWRYS